MHAIKELAKLVINDHEICMKTNVSSSRRMGKNKKTTTKNNSSVEVKQSPQMKNMKVMNSGKNVTIKKTMKQKMKQKLRQRMKKRLKEREKEKKNIKV